MQSIEIRQVHSLALANLPRMGWLGALRRVVASAAAALRRRIRSNYDASSNLDGCAWTDSLEREVNDQAAMCRRLRL